MFGPPPRWVSRAVLSSSEGGLRVPSGVLAQQCGYVGGGVERVRV